jgi:hypothetical protein
MNFDIGQYYRYPGSEKKYKLVKRNQWTFVFECGHWCTDTVFEDLVNCRTGIPVHKDIQIRLFLNE